MWVAPALLVAVVGIGVVGRLGEPAAREPVRAAASVAPVAPPPVAAAALETADASPASADRVNRFTIDDVVEGASGGASGPSLVRRFAGLRS